jgi:hypothetical protein
MEQPHLRELFARDIAFLYTAGDSHLVPVLACVCAC